MPDGPKEMNPRAWIVTKQGMTGDLYEALAWDHIYSPHGYYLAQIRPAGCRKWRTIKGARGDRKFRLVSKAVIAAAKNMKKGLRARVIFCSDWHEPMVAWEARWT